MLNKLRSSCGLTSGLTAALLGIAAGFIFLFAFGVAANIVPKDFAAGASFWICIAVAVFLPFSRPRK